MIALKKETKSNLANLLGLKLEELDKLSVSEEIAHIETRLSGEIFFSRKRDTRKTGRGNPLLARKRIRTMEDIEKRLDKMKW